MAGLLGLDRRPDPAVRLIGLVWVKVRAPQGLKPHVVGGFGAARLEAVPYPDQFMR